MDIKVTDPRFEFRVFGQELGCVVASLMARSPLENRAMLASAGLSIKEQSAEPDDEGLQTYILSPSNQTYNIKLRNHRLDTKLLLRYYEGLERWQPYLNLAFPLTSAFLHEFFFAWLEVEPPLLRRAQYTEDQFLQELILPNPILCAVQVHKARRRYTVNDCQMEITALTVDKRYHTYTVAVESTAAEPLLRTLAALDLHTFTNTNYMAGLSQLLGMDARLEAALVHDVPNFTPDSTGWRMPELVLAR